MIDAHRRRRRRPDARRRHASRAASCRSSRPPSAPRAAACAPRSAPRRWSRERARSSEPQALSRCATRCCRPTRAPTSRSSAATAAGCGTTTGREYLDFVAGIAVVGLGHCAPAPLAAAHEQLDRLWHASNLYWTEPMLRLAGAPRRALRRRAGVLLQLGRRGERGGAQDRAQGDRPHADRRARGRLPRPHARRALGHRPAGEVGGLRPARARRLASRGRTTSSRSRRRSRRPATRALILLEPVLGEGGVIPLEPAFVQAAAELAREVGALLCVDEVQTGHGPHRDVLRLRAARHRARPRHARQGPRATACRSARCSPASAPRRDSCPGDHGSTFGGNPVVAAAAVRRRRGDRRRAARERRASAARSSRRASRRCPACARCAGAACCSAPSSTGRSARSSTRAATRGLLVLSAGPGRAAPDAAARRQRRRGRARRSAILEEVLACVNRRERQAAILRLVQDRALSTQAELVQALRDEGHDVVQTTVSRDVDELGLVEGARAERPARSTRRPGTGDADRLRAIGAAMRRYATGVEAASSGLVVVTTPSGYASALAQAIDEGGHPAHRRHARRRQHDLPRPAPGNDRRRAERRAGRAPRPRKRRVSRPLAVHAGPNAGLRPRRGRLQGCAPPQAGIERRDSTSADSRFAQQENETAARGSGRLGDTGEGGCSCRSARRRRLTPSNE